MVDDFGVKYTKEKDKQHLIECLEKRYIVMTDWQGTLFNGISLAWDYEQRHVTLSMPGYVQKALHKFKHPPLTMAQDSLHEWYKTQYRSPNTIPEDKTKTLDKQGIKRIQEIVGTFLFYARAVDNTILTAFNAISMRQAAAAKDTARKITHFLNYAAMHPEATIRYHTSDMALHIHADASYLSEPKGKSRIAVYYFLTDSAINPDK